MANKVKINAETAITFSDTATQALTLNNLAAGAGRYSGQYDLTTSARTEWFFWQGVMQFATPPVVGELVDIYTIWTPTGLVADGNLGTADGVLPVALAPNLHYIGSVVVTTTEQDANMIASGICRIPTRYVQIGVINNTADNLRATNDTSKVTLVPIPPEIQ